VARPAGLDDVQRERVIALAGEGGGSGDERFFLAAGEQAERCRLLGGGEWVQVVSVWVPVAGALVVQAGGEPVPDDQVGNDRAGVVAECSGQVAAVQGDRR
jgi:hypothetical protein